ncbi:MAG: transposase, partial [Bacteroidota bacterium]
PDAQRKGDERLQEHLQTTWDAQLVCCIESCYRRSNHFCDGKKNAGGLDFIAVMDSIIVDYPDQEIHVILDNYSTHKKNEDWLAAHPLVHFHFTPTSVSWLNMVEIWFGIFSRKSLLGASFSSKEHLRKHIEAYNQNHKPFIWRKREVKGSQLKNNIDNLSN